MAWPLLAGAGLALGGIFLGSNLDRPENISVDYPSPDPIEQEIVKLQLELAGRLRDKVNDPQLMKDIYSLLPEDKMSEEDRMRFTQEYAKISEDATLAAMGEAGKAMGRDIDELVDKGILTEKQGNEQRIENEARIRAMMSVLQKRLDASRIGFARNAWLKEQKSNLNEASVIANVDQTNRNLLNETVQSGLGYFQKRNAGEFNLQSSVNEANIKNYLSAEDTKSSFRSGIFKAAAETGLGILKDSKERQELEDILRRYSGAG